MIDFSLTFVQSQALIEGFDSLLEVFGKECKLVYQPKLVDCENCIQLAVSTYASSSWGTGGPLRIDQQGVCTLCGGTNKRTQEYSENITMSILWTPKIQNLMITNVKMDYDLIQTRGYIEDLPKVKNCIELQIQLPIQNYIMGRYHLKGDGFDQFGLVQNRYFIATWERV